MGLDLNPNRSCRVRSGTLRLHFWGYAITVCTRGIQAKPENAGVQEAVDTLLHLEVFSRRLENRLKNATCNRQLSDIVELGKSQLAFDYRRNFCP